MRSDYRYEKLTRFSIAAQIQTYQKFQSYLIPLDNSNVVNTIIFDEDENAKEKKIIMAFDKSSDTC